MNIATYKDIGFQLNLFRYTACMSVCLLAALLQFQLAICSYHAGYVNCGALYIVSMLHKES